jgi:cytochrome d ubiquinol oxidase subunit II
MSLNSVWFSLIALLWTGYFLLEGFDFGVGIIAPFISRDDVDRRLALNSIGPFWDGNEVWLIVAGGATFAAFPTWYAVMLSGLYLPVFLVLVALILRGAAFEFRNKRDDLSWHRIWDSAHFIGSILPPFVWGILFVDLLHGLDIGPGFTYSGGFLGLVHPVALAGGVIAVAICVEHGANFLSLKTTGTLRDRARKVATLLAVPLAALAGGTVLWWSGSSRTPLTGNVPALIPQALLVLALLALLATGWFAARSREGLAFLATSVAIIGMISALFLALFPRVMVSSVGSAYSLDIWNSASAHETLLFMTVVAAIFTPFVLLYQGYSYWIFRKRLHRPTAGALGGH